jgi:hypothetical protein
MREPHAYRSYRTSMTYRTCLLCDPSDYWDAGGNTGICPCGKRGNISSRIDN